LAWKLQKNSSTTAQLISWQFFLIRALDPDGFQCFFINEKPLKWYIITQLYIPYLPICHIDIKSK
jgi:hypothetical protein